MVSHFELRLAECGTSAGKIDLDASVWIDGEFLDQPYYINVPELIHSIHEPGNYEIFVCGCGGADCAGTTAVHVAHDGDLIRWVGNLPVCDSEPAGDHDGPFAATPVAFLFEREQMLQAVNSFLRAARELIGTNPDGFDWPVASFTAESLIGIAPNRPCDASE